MGAVVEAHRAVEAERMSDDDAVIYERYRLKLWQDVVAHLEAAESSLVMAQVALVYLDSDTLSDSLNPAAAAIREALKQAQSKT